MFLSVEAAVHFLFTCLLTCIFTYPFWHKIKTKLLEKGVCVLKLTTNWSAVCRNFSRIRFSEYQFRMKILDYPTTKSVQQIPLQSLQRSLDLIVGGKVARCYLPCQEPDPLSAFGPFWALWASSRGPSALALRNGRHSPNAFRTG